MVDMNYWLDRRNAVLANAQPAQAGQALPGKTTDPFAGLKAGASKTVGNFTGTNMGGVTVIGSQPSAAGAIDGLLQRGYDLKAATDATVGAAASDLDTVNAKLRPAESAADVLYRRAAANLTGEQAKIVAPESTARIAGINADIGLTRANTGMVGAQTGAVKRQQRVYSATDAEAQAAAQQRAAMMPYLSSLGVSFYRLSGN